MGTRYFIIGTLAERNPNFLGNLDPIESSHGLAVFYDPKALPMAWTTEVWQSSKKLRHIKSIDEITPVDGLSLLAPAPKTPFERKPAPVRDAYNGYNLSISAENTSVLVIPYNVYPGWEVFVNNMPQKIGRAYKRFKAVAIPPGEHQVRFQFRSTTIFWGSLISALSWLSLFAFCLNIFLRHYLRQRSEKRKSEDVQTDDDEGSDSPLDG